VPGFSQVARKEIRTEFQRNWFKKSLLKIALMPEKWSIVTEKVNISGRD